MRISFLIHNIYGVGGTNRTVINLATELSRNHDVEIVSILRRLEKPMLEIPSRVSVVGLVDLRKGTADSTDSRMREVSRLTPHDEEFFRFYSRLTDERITNYLRSKPYDVVVGTRSALNLAVARLGRPGSVRIAQEHMTQDMIPPTVHEEMRRWYPQLSAVTTVTQADAAAVRAVLGDTAPPVVAIPNSVPKPGLEPARGDQKIVVAAGRLDEIKRYDLLVRAFAKVITERPDWTLRIYGSGGQSRPLGTLIADLGLHNHVFRMGGYTPLDAEWVKGSIAAVTSDKESFGMTIVEAMRCGLPVISTNCPVGPVEIIKDGVDGVLVPTGDVDAIAGALLRLMNDPDMRQRMSAAAVENASRYDPVPIAARYEQLFTEHLTSPQRRRLIAPRLNTSRQALRSTGRAIFRVVPGLKTRIGSEPPTIASCHMADGNVIVTFPGDRLPRNLTHLVCKPRRIEGVKKAVKFALTGDAVTGWSASFPAELNVFAEGRWDLHAKDNRDGLHRLRSGLLDIRDLIGGGVAIPFVRNIPYPTSDGYLALAVWNREEHAEAGEIWYGEDTITLNGRLVTGDFGNHVPTLVLNRRGEYPDAMSIAGTTSGNGNFSFDVPIPALAGRRILRYEDWDVSVSRGPGGVQIPVARLMDDVVERKRVYVYPSVLVENETPIELYEESPEPEVRVWPYLSIQSALALVVSDRPA
ncbi:glycosyltransferase family 4 protein [Actinoplanes missouriensis]|uniref:glycosyltransferase family 4 protein n=1 Tax=Actinoplanes missouriensis TaxID=1866 RepID=UPI00340BC12E